jgi:subtilisin-like proprotein convertase family protein
MSAIEVMSAARHLIEGVRMPGRSLSPTFVSRIAHAGAILATLCLGAAPSSAQPAPQSSPAAKIAQPQVAGESVSYYDGARRIDLVLALDELRVETPAAASSAAPTPTAARAIASRLRLAPQPGHAGLNAEAARVTAAQPGAKVSAVLYPARAASRSAQQAQLLTNRLSVKLAPGNTIDAAVAKHNLRIVEKVSYSPDTYILEASDPGLLAALDAANAIHASGVTEFSTPLIVRQRQKRLVPNDPLFAREWHLSNTGANTGVTGLAAGNDVNITGVWDTYQGTGVNIAIADDGLQTSHPDLMANARWDIDIDINYGDNDPTPDTSIDDHGTACAGVAAGRGDNGVGVSGAAPRAALVGVRLISLGVTDAQEAQGLTHQLTPVNPADRVHISSNSWGPSDDGATLEGPGPLTRAAIANATTVGRGGNGLIYTWAGGNGGSGDNANFDGYANDRHTIAVGASGGAGEKSSYSEEGACLLVNAPSSYAGGGITTVDRTGSSGYEDPPGDYTYSFGGTSSAAPLVAGCIALVLEANPNLSWRDVQDILARSSSKNQPADAGWITNGAGLSFNHKFGFGRINVGNAVTSATAYTPLPAEAPPITATETIQPAVAIPDNNTTGVTRTLNLAGPSGFVAEHVEVQVGVTHTWRGDLEILLTSPSGTTATIAAVRGGDNADDFNNWTFASLAQWGEDPVGTWTLKIADRAAADVGTISSWTVKAYGHLSPVAEIADWSLFN